jgi:hypothetical protein
MAVLTAGSAPVEYRYFVADLMTNEILAEIPFRSVSYSRSLTEAGSFQGDIAVTDATYNLSLYENTMPAKTALYITRKVGNEDALCVWGGIIWGRNYSLVDKILSITALEFTSYLSHRVVWKTWNSSYEAEAVVSGGTATVTLTGGEYNFTVGESVYIYWQTDYTLYNGYFEIESVSSTVDNRSIITVPASYVNSSGIEVTIPEVGGGEPLTVTVETRQDTYQYAQDLIRELNTDLFDFDFANDEIRPGIDLFNEIDTVSRTSNVATVVTTKKHELVEGQKVIISDVQADSGSFNNLEAIVTGIDLNNAYVFTYESSGSDVSTTTETDNSKIVSRFNRGNNVSTLETTQPHLLGVGDIVRLENVSQTFDGYASVSANVSDYIFQVVQIGAAIGNSYTEVRSGTTITGASGDGSTVTFTATNDFEPDDRVTVDGVFPSTYDGIYTVESATSSSFTVSSNVTSTYVSDGTASPTYNPRVVRHASAQYGTFGEHSTLGDIGFDLSENPNLSSNLEANPVIRGYELKTVYEVLEDYATKPNGFEYRIDAEYDPTTDTFKKKFRFLPILPDSLTQYLDAQGSGFSGAIPASAYGADELVFEFPGNVLEAQFDENAEDAATRFFVQGKDSRLSADASQPYSAASNHKLLNQGWPILDLVDDLDSDNETVLWKQASRLLGESVPPISTFTISVNGSANPKLGTYKPGDWCSVKLNDDFVSLRASSYLEQDYGTDAGVLVRKIISYNVNVPDVPGYPEEVELELVTEPAIPISGVTIIDGKPFNGD